jgi:hypothetical protein
VQVLAELTILKFGIMNIRIENYTIISDMVYPDFFSATPEFEKVEKLTEESVRELIGSLMIANKYIVLVCGKLLYQHDGVTFLCNRLR